MDQGNIVCSSCNRLASVFCNCMHPGIALCSTCFPSHITLRPSIPHVATSVLLSDFDNAQITPHEKRWADTSMCLCHESRMTCWFCRSGETKKRRIGLYDTDNSSVFDGMNAYWAKQTAIDFLSREVSSNLNSLDLYKQELLKAREAILLELDNILNARLQEINYYNNSLNQLKQELESCRTLPSLNQEWNWAHVLINKYTSLCKSLSPPPLKLVSWTVDPKEIITSLSKLSSFSADSNPARCISYLKPKTNIIRNYNTCSGEVTSITLNTSKLFKPGGAWCELPGQNLVYTGGNQAQASNEVYLIDPSTSSLTQLPSMYMARAFHSVVYYEGSVYVFGGCNGNTRLKTCEKLDLSKGNWMYLSNMHEARSHFTIAVVGDMFYLGGGIGSNSLETFEPKSLTFRKLIVTLPHESYWTLMAPLENRVIILQGNKQLSYSPEDKRLKQDAALVSSANSNWWSEMNPVVHDGRVYFFRKGGLWSLEHKTGNLREVVQF